MREIRETEEERAERLANTRKKIFGAIFTFIVIVMFAALVSSNFAFEAKQRALADKKKAEQEAAEARKSNQELRATIAKQRATIDSLTKLLKISSSKTK
jgi:uncharacterized membrane protein